MKPRATRLDGLANPSLRNAHAAFRQQPPAVALVPLYTPGVRSAGNWLMGRTSAECGRCGYPLLLAHPEKEPRQ